MVEDVEATFTEAAANHDPGVRVLVTRQAGQPGNDFTFARPRLIAELEFVRVPRNRVAEVPALARGDVVERNAAHARAGAGDAERASRRRRLTGRRRVADVQRTPA